MRDVFDLDPVPAAPGAVAAIAALGISLINVREQSGSRAK
jgi:hypothetical protein